MIPAELEYEATYPIDPNEDVTDCAPMTAEELVAYQMFQINRSLSVERV